MARVIEGHVIASTHLDLDGERIPHSTLRKLFTELPDPWILNREHDLSRPPVGKGFNKRLEPQPDGELAIKMDIEVWDESLLEVPGRGISIAFQRTSTRLGMGAPDLNVLMNPRQFDYKVTVDDIARLRPQNLTVEVTERVEKAWIQDAAIITLVVYVGDKILGGALGVLGRNVIEYLMRRGRKDSPGKPVELHFHFHVNGQPSMNLWKVDREVSIDELVSIPLEKLGEIPSAISRREGLVRVAGRLLPGNRLQVDYAIYSDGEIIKVRRE
jgi:hypothetical protein